MSTGAPNRLEPDRVRFEAYSLLACGPRRPTRRSGGIAGAADRVAAGRYSPSTVARYDRLTSNDGVRNRRREQRDRQIDVNGRSVYPQTVVRLRRLQPALRSGSFPPASRRQ